MAGFLNCLEHKTNQTDMHIDTSRQTDSKTEIQRDRKGNESIILKNNHLFTIFSFLARFGQRVESLERW